MNFLKKLTFLLIFVSFEAFSSQLPRYLGSEKKFRSYVFNPNEVYRYLGHYTYQGFIEFGKEEAISTISMGDPSLWLFEHLGNRLFLKPVGQDHSQTNMTVITNKHIYHFELTAKEAKNIDDKDLIFVAKFVYPDEKDKNILEFPRILASDEPDMSDLSIYNFNYQYTGETTIAPVKVFDNGNFTYFQFSHKNAEIPAIFSVDASGYEAMVNFRAAGDYIIVEKVARQFTLRNGSDIVCVYNNGGVGGGRAGGAAAMSKNPAFAAPRNFAAPRASFFGAPKNEQKMTYPRGGLPPEQGPAGAATGFGGAVPKAGFAGVGGGSGGFAPPPAPRGGFGGARGGAMSGFAPGAGGGSGFVPPAPPGMKGFPGTEGGNSRGGFAGSGVRAGLGSGPARQVVKSGSARQNPLLQQGADPRMVQKAMQDLARGRDSAETAKVRAKLRQGFSPGFGIGEPSSFTGITGAAGMGGTGGPALVDDLVFEPPLASSKRR